MRILFANGYRPKYPGHCPDCLAPMRRGEDLDICAADCGRAVSYKIHQGAKNRALKLSPERRREIAMMGVAARRSKTDVFRD